VVSNLESSVPGQLDFVRDHYIVEAGGFRFGVFGLLTVGTPAAQFPENVAGIEFLPEKNYLLNMPERLREEGADFVILLAHLGMYDENRTSRTDLLELISSLPGNGAANIDVIFDGHSHITRFEKMPKNNDRAVPTWFVQSAKYGEQLGELKLQLCTESRAIVKAEAEFHDLDVTKNPADEDFLRTNRHDWVEALKISRKRVATTAPGFILPHDRFHAFHKGLASFAVARSFYDYGREQGVEVDFACAINRGVRYHLASSAGKISRAAVHRVCPFENKLVFARIKGIDLLKIIKTDGRRLTFYGLQFVMTEAEHQKKDAALDALEINLINADGTKEPVSADRVYTVAMQDYLAQASNFDFFKTLYDLQTTGISDQDVLAWFLSELSKQRQAENSRITVAEFEELSNRFLQIK
jgi:2',3'-cyclic-nucleotide 2'-phosphodiesterase (5'-nucleotidase family)